MKRAIPAILAALAVGGGAYAASLQANPYSGLETREIKALSPDHVGDLLAGRGAGYALSAELNGYPGPRHVLDLSDELALDPEQRERTAALFAAMEAEARPLGAELMRREHELETMFRSRDIDETRLFAKTAEIGELEARLRATHLKYHISMAGLLSPAQRAAYDRLRGYGGAVQPEGGHQGHGAR